MLTGVSQHSSCTVQLNRCKISFVQNNMDHENIISALLLTVIVCVGLPENLLVLLTVTRNPRFHVVRCILPASLALCDFLYLLLVVFFHATSLWCGAWVFGMPWCYGSALVLRMVYFLRIFLFCIISYDRYNAIVRKPLSYNGTATRRKIVSLVLSPWILAALISVGTALADWRFVYKPNTFKCEQEWKIDSVEGSVAVVFFAVFFLVAPCALVTKLNYSVLGVARTQARQIRAAEIPGKSNDCSQQQIKKKLRVGKAAADIALAIGVFLICFIPEWVCKILQNAFKMDLPLPFLLASNILFHSNAVWNPIFYSFRKKEFREAVKKLFRRRPRVQPHLVADQSTFRFPTFVQEMTTQAPL